MVIFSPSALFGRTPVTKRHGESRILRTHPLHLFRIIQDVDRYCEFLPLCSYSRIDPATISSDGRTFEARLVVGRPPLFVEEYTSRVKVQPERLQIDAQSTSSKYGQFDSLKSTWRLQPVRLWNDDGDDGDDGDGDNTADTMKTDGGDAPFLRNVGCHVDLEVEMTVSDPMVVTILDQILMHVAGRQVEAFDRRCGEVPLPSRELFEMAERLLENEQQ